MLNLKELKVDALKEQVTAWGLTLPEGAKKQEILEILQAEEARRSKLEQGTLEFGNTEFAEENKGNNGDEASEVVGQGIDEILAGVTGEKTGDEIKPSTTDEVKEFEDQMKNDEPVLEDYSAVPVVMLPVGDLTPSKMNFFKALSPNKYEELKDSIKNNGLLMPIIVRPNKTGKEKKKQFEILAGENRYRIFIELGKTEIPTRIMEVSDDKAKEILVDTNVAQRQELSPMEIAKAYNEKKRILGNRKGQRSDLNSDAEAGATRDLIAQEYGKSGMTIDRYLRLINLLPQFQELVDDGKVPAKTGMELGLLDQATQKLILETNAYGDDNISTKNVTKVKKALAEKRKLEVAKEENKGKKDIVVALSADEMKLILNTDENDVGNDAVKALKFTVEVPADFDEDTKDFIEGNLITDKAFLLNLIKLYVHGKLVEVKEGA